MRGQSPGGSRRPPVGAVPSRAATPPEPADERPGLPGFTTWGGVYLFVFVVFVLVVVALSIFTSVFA